MRDQERVVELSVVVDGGVKANDEGVEGGGAPGVRGLGGEVEVEAERVVGDVREPARTCCVREREREGDTVPQAGRPATVRLTSDQCP